MADMKFRALTADMLPRALNLCERGILCAESYTYLNVNRKFLSSPGYSSVWCAENSAGEISALLCGGADCTGIIAPGEEICASLGGFLGFTGSRFIFGEERILAPAGFGGGEKIYIMKYERELEISAGDYDIRVLDSRGIHSMYEMLSGLMSDSAEKRYIYRVRCVNNGFARCFAEYRGGRMAACASVSAENLDSCLISDVKTHEDFRRTGCASRLVAQAVRYCLNKHKAAYVYCRGENVGFYEKNGFTVIHTALMSRCDSPD